MVPTSKHLINLDENFLNLTRFQLNMFPLKKLISISIVLLLLFVCMPLSSAADWPMFGHDASHSGSSDDSILTPMKLLWTVKIDSSGGKYGLSSPVIVDGGVHIGSNFATLYSVDLKTGTINSQFSAAGKIITPTISDNIIYSAGYAGHIIAIDALSGNSLWKFKMGTEAEPFPFIVSAPTVYRGVLYVSATDNTIYSLNKDGKVVRRYAVGDDVRTSPAISGAIFSAADDGYVYAHEFDGSIRWKTKIKGIPTSSISVYQNFVFVGSDDGHIYSIDRITGEINWDYRTGDAIESTPAISNDTLYVGSNDDYVYAFDIETGEKKWVYKTQGDVKSSPAIAGNLLFIGSNDNYFYVLDTSSGSEKWTYKTNGMIEASPAISDGIVLVKSNDGYLYAFTSDIAIISSEFTHSIEKLKLTGLNTYYIESTIDRTLIDYKAENYGNSIRLLAQADADIKDAISISEKISSIGALVNDLETTGTNLVTIKDSIDKIKKLYEKNDFNEANKLIEQTTDELETVDNIYKTMLNIENTINEAKVNNINTSNADLLLSQTKDAYTDGQYDVVMNLIDKIKILQENDFVNEQQVPLTTDAMDYDKYKIYIIVLSILLIPLTYLIQKNYAKNRLNDNLTASDDLVINRETEFYEGFIRFKMSFTNKSQYMINDVAVDFDFDSDLLRMDRHEPDYSIKNSKIMLGNISGNSSKSIAIYLDPMMCSKGTDINCQINYKDAKGQPQSTQMEPKKISVVCPIMKTDSDINIGRLKEFVENLPQRDSKVYQLHAGFDIKQLKNITHEIVQKHDVKHIRTLHTKDGKTCEIWYYGKTKVNSHNIVMRITISGDTQSIELFAATPTPESLAGLLAEVGREIKSAIDAKTAGDNVKQVLNVTIKDSIIQRSNLLSFCDINGNCTGDVVIEDSSVQRSGIGLDAQIKDNGMPKNNSSVNSCPACEMELPDGAKFCLDCGENLIK